MFMNVKMLRRAAAMLLLVMLVSATMCACVNTDDGTDLIDEYSVDLTVSSKAIEESVDDISTEEGHTEAPTVEQLENVTPDTVAICGKCEEGATIRVTGGEEDVETTAIGDYYIICTKLKYSNNLLKITAQVEGKEISAEREFVASYQATADKRLDGNSVSVGIGSHLYFDKMVEDMSGDNLYTASQLNTIRDYVADTVTGYYNDRAGGQKAELIYVLLPDVTTIYPEIVPEGVVGDTNTTIYDQILGTLKQTRATVVDLRETFMALKEDEQTAENGGIYRITDSALTDYGAYIAYSEIQKVIEKNFPDAKARTMDEFDWKKVKAKGGNLVNFRELDKDIITEDIIVATPKFSFNYGTNGAGTSSLSALRKYVDKDNADYNFFTTVDNNDNINGIAERWLVDTARKDSVNLPNTLIYHDYGALSFLDILIERTEKSMIAKSEDFAVNLSNTLQYAADGKNVVDYIIVIVSEENMDNAFSLAFAG